MAEQAGLKYPFAIKKRVEGDWNCPNCDNLNFAFRDRCNKCDYQKEIVNAFDSVLYITPPSTFDEYQEPESECNCRRLCPSELPSVSPFFQDKFMNTPTEIKPVTSRLLSFERQKENSATIVTGNYKIIANKKDLNQFMSGIKKPNTKRMGDWVCLQCKNLNFAFRNSCNVCASDKKEYIQLNI